MNNIYDIWFARIEIANSIKKRLLKQFSSKEIFKLKREELAEIDLKETTIKKILDEKYRDNLEKYLDYMEKNKIFQIFENSEQYPDKLKVINNSPTYIFARRKLRITI